jgi:hypothetical protein
MRLHLVLVGALGAGLMLCGLGAAAIAQVTPSIAVGQIDGDADGSFAEKLAAALDAGLAPGGVQATCPLKRLGADAATSILGQIVNANGTLSARIALQGQPIGAEPAAMVDYGPADSMEDLAAMIAADLLRTLCASGADLAPPVMYEASGGGPRIVISGRIAAYDKPFTLQGEFPGAQVVFEYVPVSPVGGAVDYEFSGGGFSGAGNGVYTIANRGDGTFLIEQTTNGCVDGVANSCAQNSEKIVLTPVLP